MQPGALIMNDDLACCGKCGRTSDRDPQSSIAAYMLRMLTITAKCKMYYNDLFMLVFGLIFFIIAGFISFLSLLTT